MEPTNKGPETLAGEQFPSDNESVLLTPQETSTVRAEKSGGPRTQQGKENCKRNALRHGIFSQVVLLKGEPQAEFYSLLNGLRKDLEPEGTLEEILVDKLAAIVWRHRRVIIALGEKNGKVTDFLENLGAATPLDLCSGTKPIWSGPLIVL